VQTDSDRNQSFYSSSVKFFAEREEAIFPVEQLVIDSLDIDWRDTRMLDIGVGAGRTTQYFAHLVRHYVGIDYSEQLVEYCRDRFGESTAMQFAVGDARHLEDLQLDAFDFVFFSFNGIDYVTDEERQQVLRSVHATLADNGWFFFSSHSLHGVSKWWSSPSLSIRQPFASLVKTAKALIKVPLLLFRNRGVDLHAAREEGYTTIEDGAYRFGVETYYVDPIEQVRQLEDAGFDVFATYSKDGEQIDPTTTREAGWISYLARPMGGAALGGS
jgi:SAM-dependent methyltransferase